jgi:hypothetical protein
MSYSLINANRVTVSKDGTKLLSFSTTQVTLSTDKGVSWSVISNINLGGTLLYDFWTWSSADFQKILCIYSNNNNTTGQIVSTNGGVSWYTPPVNFLSDSEARFICVAENTQVLYWYNYGNGYIYKSIDWGNSASTLIQVSSITGGLTSLACNSTGTIFYGGSGSTIWKSTNSGTTWKTTALLTEDRIYLTPNFAACSEDGQVILTGTQTYIGSGSGYFYMSVDGGSSFSKVNNRTGTWDAVGCSRDGNVIVGTSVAANPEYIGQVLVSTNRGGSFQDYTIAVYTSVGVIPATNSNPVSTRRVNVSNQGGIICLGHANYQGDTIFVANNVTVPTPTITIDGQIIGANSTYTAKARTTSVNLVVTPAGTSTVISITGSTNVNDDLNTINIIISYLENYATFTVYVMVLRNCFKEGTKILCLLGEEEEYIRVEELRKGTLVKTSLNGYVPVHSIGHSKLYNPANKLRGLNRLYKCTKENYPEVTEDVVMTGCHSILVDESEITDEIREKTRELTRDNVWVTDHKCRLMTCLDERAKPYEEEGVFNIWHFALEHFDKFMNYGVYANGLLVETCDINSLHEYSGLELV